MIAKKWKMKKGKDYQALFFSILIGFLILGAVSFFIISNLRINQKRADLTSQIEELKKEIQIMETKNEQLRAGIVQTQTEIYWEEKAREQGYKKPGEETVVVLPPEEGEVKEEEKSFWQKILEKLGF